MTVVAGCGGNAIFRDNSVKPVAGQVFVSGFSFRLRSLLQDILIACSIECFQVEAKHFLLNSRVNSREGSIQAGMDSEHSGWFKCKIRNLVSL